MASLSFLLFVVLLLTSLGSSKANEDEEPKLVKATGSQFLCGEEGTQAGGRRLASAEAHHFSVTLASPTTWNLRVNDQLIQRQQRFHPLKCVIHDPDEGKVAAGRMLILGKACWLKNADYMSCFRKSNFPFPVNPSEPILKIEMFVAVTSQGVASWEERDGLMHKSSRETDVLPTEIALEVCAIVGDCQPNSGFCVPAFYFVYDTEKRKALRAAVRPKMQQFIIPHGVNDTEKAAIMSDNADIITANKIARRVQNSVLTPFYNAWEEVESFQGAENEPRIEEVWRQPHALPSYGPYPHCPEDDKGRALPCKGDEKLTIHLVSLELLRAEFLGDKVAFSLRYKLEWGDRYAVHPCTINLYNIHTSGKQYTIPTAGYWLPAFKARHAKQAESVTSAGSSLGVNTFPGHPVTKKVASGAPGPNSSALPFPKQLVFNRKYEVEFHPSKTLNWGLYPFDDQTFQLQISDMAMSPSQLILDASRASFTDKNARVGHEFKKKSASVDVVMVHGRQHFQVTVKVSRSTEGKLYSLILPVISVAFMDIAHNLLTSYDDLPKLFLTTAVVAGVGVHMVSPEFLGIPHNLTVIPFMQCFTLMLLVGGLKQMILVLLRMVVQKKATEKKLAQYDCIIKWSVPAWYIVSWLLVVIAYLV